MAEWNWSDTHVLHKAHHSLLLLWNTRRHSVVHLEYILNSKITNTKHRNAKSVAQNWPWKGCLFRTELTMKRSWNKAEHYLVLPQLGMCAAGCSNFSVICKWLEGPRILIWLLQIHFSQQANLQILNPQLQNGELTLDYAVLILVVHSCYFLRFLKSRSMSVLG